MTNLSDIELSDSRGEQQKGLQVFTENEAEFLASNFLGRIATVSVRNQPHVVPVAYRFDGSKIYFGGWNLQNSLKFRNLASNNKVAFVVDEVISTRPWRVKGIEVRGTAEPRKGDGGDLLVTITPTKVRSWGLEE